MLYETVGLAEVFNCYILSFIVLNSAIESMETFQLGLYYNARFFGFTLTLKTLQSFNLNMIGAFLMIQFPFHNKETYLKPS